MAEYIMRQAVLDAYEEEQRKNGPWRFETLIESVPAADVVPVVRCRECIHWHDWGACGHPDNGFDAPSMGPGDFCSKGEPKNELE